MNNFSNNLTQILKTRNLSVQQLAELSSIRRSYLSRLLHGHHSPRLTIVEKIAKSLRVNAYELLTPPAKKKKKKTD
jgi:transcriptional regulator with XRE-family HTH domain